VPAQERLRRKAEDSPAFARQDPRERGEKQPISSAKPRTRSVPGLEHKPVAKHHVLGQQLLKQAIRGSNAHDPTNERVDDQEEHARIVRRLAAERIVLLDPNGWSIPHWQSGSSPRFTDRLWGSRTAIDALSRHD